ncbi:MAG: hypothetical protein AB8E15_13050 [Bdellovibrionales bacterium]
MFRYFTMALRSLILTLFLVACEDSKEAFNFFEEEIGPGSAIEDVEIINFTPTANEIRLTSVTQTTFAVSVNASAGSKVTFNWQLNGVTLSGEDKPFIDISGTALTAGANSLLVTASNEQSSDSQSFNLSLNQAPVIDTFTPGIAGNLISCGSGTLQFTVTASDPDADGLSFVWKLNGSANPSSFSETSSVGGSVLDFTPSCALSGANSVSLEVTDGFDTTIKSWSVSVINPSVAQINSYSPLGAITVIPSTGSQAFSISATGKDPLAYAWRLNGTAIPGETSSFINLSAGTLAAGTYTLTAEVSDFDSNDSQDFTVKRNAPPVISNEAPSASVTKLNYQSFATFSIDASDGNSDSLSYTWTLNDTISGYLADSVTVGGSQAIFSPDVSLIGSQTVKVLVSDGNETATYSWTVEVNYFSDACNNLQAGQICTIVGKPGLGSGVNPITSPQISKVQPAHLENDGNDNYFIADDSNDVVWFYNRSVADVTVLGTTVPAGEIKVVVGMGSQGVGTSGSNALSYKLYNPYGMAWDSVRGDLYIASYSGHRIVRVTSSGIARHDICNGSTTNNEANNSDGGLASSHQCGNVAGLEFDSANNYLYATLTSRDSIKYFDVSNADPTNWTGHIFVGRKNGSGAFSAGSDNTGVIGNGTSGSYMRVNNPWEIELGKDGIVYFIEQAGCKLKAANPTGSSVSFINSNITIAAGEVRTLSGTGNCNSTEGSYTAARFKNPRGLAIHYDGSNNVVGWFVSSDDHDRILFVNNTSSTQTIGGRTIASQEVRRVWGNGSDGYSGEGDNAFNRLIQRAWGLTKTADDSSLVIADRGNYRVRSLPVNVNNGTTVSIVAGKEKFDFSGGSNTPAPDSVINQPTNLTYDSTNNRMLFSDANNGRIRSVDLVTGAENTIIGAGLGNGDQDEEDPLDVFMRGPRGMVFHNGGLIFADKYESNGTNRNCLVRAWNANSTSTNFFNTIISPNKVSTVAGNYALGCNAWSGTYEGGAATNARIYRPEGVATDGTNLYIVNHETHCIMKVTDTGVITTYAGTCGSAGDVNGSPVNSSSIRFRYPTQIVSDPDFIADGNLFVVDQMDRTTSKIKYINNSSSSVTVSGVTVAANSIGTIYTTGGYSSGLAIFGDHICYTSGSETRGDQGSHNVICKRRSDALANATIRVGPSDGASTKGRTQLGTEEEGVAATSAGLNSPYGLAFDSDGNLYITERMSSVIRMVKKWW